MMNRIKKVMAITLATLTVFGNTFTPVQAKVLNNAPVAKIIDSYKVDYFTSEVNKIALEELRSGKVKPLQIKFK